MAKIQRHPAGRAERELRQLRLRLDTEHRFGQPSSYSLTVPELSRHARQLRRAGWQSWEIRVRFGFWRAA